MHKTTETIGRYEIRGTLGQGVTGAVYRGWDTRLELDVAIKVLLVNHDDANHQEEIQRFLREVKISRTLKHPNIASVYDVDDDPVTGRPYIVMEFVQGKPLNELLKDRQLSIREIVKLFQQLAGGLDSAAQAGIVHRDVKPANILVDPATLHPKLVDFGVARVEGTNVTQSGTLVGTPHYMSPEQWRGDLADGRSDLFSLGAILYEALTQRKAFPGMNFATVMAAALDPAKPVPPSDINADISLEMAGVVMKALAKHPVDRFQRGNEMSDALEAVLSDPAKARRITHPQGLFDEPAMVLRLAPSSPQTAEQEAPDEITEADAPTPRRRRWIAFAGTALALLFATGVFVWPFFKSHVFSPITLQLAVVRVTDSGQRITLLNEGDLVSRQERLGIFVNPDDTLFLYVWHTDSTGKVIPIFPNHDTASPKNPLEPKRALWLLSPKGQRGLVRLPNTPGLKKVTVVAAPNPLHRLHDGWRLLSLIGLEGLHDEDDTLSDPRQPSAKLKRGRDTGTFIPPDPWTSPPIRYLEGDPNGFYYEIEFKRL